MRAKGELEAFIRANPTMTQAEISAAFGCSRQAVSAKFKRMGAKFVPVERPVVVGPLPDVDADSAPVSESTAVVAVERVFAEENFLATEQGKAKLAGRIGSKMEMLMEAMTPEKAARASIKDLSIAFGVMTDKQRQINDSTSSGQGLLAAALIKAVAQQIGSALGRELPEALPEPTQVIPVEGVVTDA